MYYHTCRSAVGWAQASFARAETLNKKSTPESPRHPGHDQARYPQAQSCSPNNSSHHTSNQITGLKHDRQHPPATDMALDDRPTQRPQRKMAPTQCTILHPAFPAATKAPVAKPPPLRSSQSPIPSRYYHKSLALKSRIAEITTWNTAARERLTRNNRALSRAQLERAFLLEQVANLTPKHETQGSPKSPGSKVVTVRRLNGQQKVIGR